MSEGAGLSGRGENTAAAESVLVECIDPKTYPSRKRHRQMARAAIRVALRYGIEDKLILAEYLAVRVEEAGSDA